jgi:hypothetical protein
MSHPSSDQQLSSTRPALLFVIGLVLGFLPLILFLSTYFRINPLYPRHLFFQHMSFNLCSGDPSPDATKRAVIAVCLYVGEWVGGLGAGVAVWWSKTSGWWVFGLFTALALDLFVFGGIMYYSLLSCGPIVPV